MKQDTQASPPSSHSPFAIRHSPSSPPTWVSVGALTAVTAIWGWSFLLVKDSVAGYPVFPFLAIRFTLGFLLVFPFLSRRLRNLDRGSLVGGILMGTALFSGYSLQTTGLLYTSAANSGFITGLFVVLTPVFEAVLFRRFPRPAAWAAVLIATLGLGLLSLQGGVGAMNRGDLLSLACAVVYAIHLLLTSTMAKRHDTGVLVIVQVGTVALLAWIFSIPYAREMLPIPRATLWGIGITAVFATALAYWAQTTFQRFLSALQTALIFTLEPVFAGLFAVVVGGEVLGLRGVLGGLFILVGMVLGQWVETRQR
jgi:drug/metabolite transporter (DMT)-like permease